MISLLAKPDFLPFFNKVITLVKNKTAPAIPTMPEFFKIVSEVHILIAASICILGIVYLMTGLKNYKLLMMFDGAIIGTFAGGLLMAWLNKPNYLLYGMVGGGTVFGVLCWPLARIFIALVGSGVGAIGGLFLFEFLASMFEMPEVIITYQWLVPIVGAVICGLLFLWIFRVGIILMTTSQGACMVVFGALCLSKGMKELHTPLKASISERPFLLLLAAGGLCAMGIAMQLLHWTGERKKRQEELQKAQQNQAASQFRPI